MDEAKAPVEEFIVDVSPEFLFRALLDRLGLPHATYRIICQTTSSSIVRCSVYRVSGKTKP